MNHRYADFYASSPSGELIFFFFIESKGGGGEDKYNFRVIKIISKNSGFLHHNG